MKRFIIEVSKDGDEFQSIYNVDALNHEQAMRSFTEWLKANNQTESINEWQAISCREI